MLSQVNTVLLSRLISTPQQVMECDSFSPVDWKSLLKLADTEGVGPLLYWNFAKSGMLTALPQQVYETLRAMYARTWAQNQKILEELGSIAQLFRQADIPLVVLKGACCILTIYPDIGLRPMGDLDILVPASRFPLAVQLAQSLGYESLRPEASPGLRALLNHEVCLHKRDGQSFPIEIHKGLMAEKVFTYSVPMDWFWEQTEPFTGRLTNPGLDYVSILTPAAQLLHAALHSMLQHGGSQTPLRWFYDLDQLIRLSDIQIDWKLLLEQAENFGWSSALHAVLSQTQTFFHTPIPDDVQSRLSAYKDRLEPLVKLKQSQPVTHILEEGQRFASLNWHGKLRLVLALLFPSADYMFWRYKLESCWTLPLWYFVHWAGILRDGIKTGLVLLKNRAHAG